MKTKKWMREAIPYVVLLILTIFVLYLLYHEMNIEKPIVYTGDGVSATYLVKTIDDTGWFLNNPFVGGIYGGNWEDYTMCDNLSFLFVKFFALFSDNCFLIFNLFFFSTFVVVSLTAYAALRALKVHPAAGVTAALLYSFQAYHQLRIYHIWLTPYYMAPLALLVGIWIATDAYRLGQFKLKEAIRNKKIIATTVILFLSAFTGFYYAFFTCIVICIAGVILLFRKFGLKQILFLGYSLFVVCVGVLANVYPSLIYWMKNGMNPESELAIRAIQDPELYSLKPIQFFMPRNQHRVKSLAEMSYKYFKEFPYNNENSFAALGIIACIGFVLLILVLFNKKKKDDCAEVISMMNIGILLVAIIGGVGSIFSYFVSTPMRCYNRLSIYIAFLALLYLALLFTKWMDKKQKTKKKQVAGIVICLVVLGVGLWDQTADYTLENQNYYTAAFDNDKEFVQKIEEKMPEGSMVYQLPLMKFPSGSSYELFKGYMHSKHTIWSYGGMQGREEDKWEMNLTNYTVEDFLKHICYGGYRGLYLDRQLMTESGKDFETYIQKLEAFVTEAPIISQDGRLYFYDLTEYYNKESARLGKKQIKRFEELEYKVIVNYSKGFQGIEEDDTGVSRRANQTGVITITYSGEEPCDYVLEGIICSDNENSEKMTITSNGEEEQIEFNQAGEEIRIPIRLQQGENKITFKREAGKTDGEDAEQMTGFRLVHPNFHVAENK